MNMKWFACLVIGTSLAATGCPSIDKDPNEGATGPTVEFDPANKIVPFPNNLLINPATGKVTLPEQCNESPTAKALREGVLNTLDGFGTFETALSVTFTEPVDMASLTDHVLLYKRASGATAVDPNVATPVPIVVFPGTTIRFDAACANPASVDSVTIVARVPLEQKSTYTVALLDGIKTANGAAFNASFTWALVRSPTPVVTLDDSGNVVSDQTPLDPADPAQLAQLQGIDLLWKAHFKALQFLAGAGHPANTILLAWEFNTQTVTDPLDPDVATSVIADALAAPQGTTPLLLNSTLTGVAIGKTGIFANCQPGDDDTQCFLKISLGLAAAAPGSPGPVVYGTGNAVCAQINCAAIDDVLGSALGSKQYQIETPNAFTSATGNKPIPGPWNDPVHPTSTKSEAIGTLVVIPLGAIPATGYPTVVFQHGLGQSKTNALVIAGQLAAKGFATVAIDAVAHDSRAIRVSDDAAKGCADAPGSQRPDKGPSSSAAPQCYAPFLSSNLAATRDNIRQTIVDQQRLIAALKACGTSQCAKLKVDPAHIVYIGQSLGGIMGSLTTAISDDLQAAVLNVPGVGWVDILENTATLQISCSLVDSLIDAGILVGDKFNPATGTGLCSTPAWKDQPGYKQFSVIGRWVIDPADPANFTSRLATKKILIQEVVDDQVVPNVATNNEGALVGLMGMNADCFNPLAGQTAPSAAITTNITSNKFVKYPNIAPGTVGCTSGNTFTHGSLLRPAPSVTGVGTCNPGATGDAFCDGSFGTGRMQTDAITFLFVNK